MSYKSSYTWPNPAFPFRIYFSDENIRVFIIENIHHNWEWMREWSHKFRPNDFFFVYCGWYYSREFAQEAEAMFNALSLDKSKFHIMFNSPHEMENFSEYNFQGDVINHNAWLDENLVMRPLDVDKQYDAIYVGRRSAFKRHMLAENVENLALIAGINHGNAVSPVPQHKYLNEVPLTPEEVCLKINESRCGLILSEKEGACFSSSEYLLCGIPVVSTKSYGGRDVWYNSYNSIVCDPDPFQIAEAVEYFKNEPRNPQIIREIHIEQAHRYRKKFIDKLADLFDEYGVENVDAEAYFKENFFHKMRRSYKPDFEEIFK
jgi:glycosyltransferase involved in cell wall biosynthesis